MNKVMQTHIIKCSYTVADKLTNSVERFANNLYEIDSCVDIDQNELLEIVSCTYICGAVLKETDDGERLYKGDEIDLTQLTYPFSACSRKTVERGILSIGDFKKGDLTFKW